MTAYTIGGPGVICGLKGVSMAFTSAPCWTSSSITGIRSRSNSGVGRTFPECRFSPSGHAPAAQWSATLFSSLEQCANRSAMVDAGQRRAAPLRAAPELVVGTVVAGPPESRLAEIGIGSLLQKPLQDGSVRDNGGEDDGAIVARGVRVPAEVSERLEEIQLAAGGSQGGHLGELSQHGGAVLEQIASDMCVAAEHRELESFV
ncbi:hypothetical protein VTN77DRAFT_9581 [Rasamsonia byssochlamydoides]|uniref:uncharacterized protein n=1 Tax=Rasamsonia byssochlamydoides TaxID=89139 RepID=UPI0037438E09